jgi:hypothetical protein
MPIQKPRLKEGADAVKEYKIQLAFDGEGEDALDHWRPSSHGITTCRWPGMCWCEMTGSRAATGAQQQVT